MKQSDTQRDKRKNPLQHISLLTNVNITHSRSNLPFPSPTPSTRLPQVSTWSVVHSTQNQLILNRLIGKDDHFHQINSTGLQKLHKAPRRFQHATHQPITSSLFHLRSPFDIITNHYVRGMTSMQRIWEPIGFSVSVYQQRWQRNFTKHNGYLQLTYRVGSDCHLIRRQGSIP